MRAFGGIFVALALGATALSGCSQGADGMDPKAVEAHVTKLLAEPLKGKATAAADLEPLRALIPANVDVTWGALSFDAATNATLVSNLKVTPKDMPTVGVQISELRLWDLDTEFLKARLSGQRLAESAPLARRIEAKGLSLFGAAALMNSMSGFSAPPAVDPTAPVTPADGVVPAPDSLGMPTEPEFKLGNDAYAASFERYDFSYDRLVLDNISLRPYDVVTPAADGKNAWGMEGPEAKIFQQLISAMRSVGIDTFAATGMKGEMAMSQMGQKLSASFGAQSMGTRGMRGGDMDASYVRDISYKFGMSPSADVPGFDAVWSVGFMGMKDFRFDKLYGYMAKGVMPPRTETDLLSFGSFSFEKQAVKVNGQDIVTIAESTFDARKFHWFIPTELTTTTKNAVIDVGAIVKMVAAATPPAPAPGEDGAAFAMPTPDYAAIVASLEKNGLSKVDLSGNFNWNWNATTGDTKIGMGFGGEKLTQFDFKYEGGFPDFQSVSSLIPDDPEMTDSAAIGKVFDAKSTLKLVDFTVADHGGLEKMFNFTADMNTIMAGPDAAAQGNPMAGQTGASLRQMAGGLLTMLGSSPDIAPFVTPFATFITEGGKVHLSMKPATPLPWSSMEQKFMGATTSPGQVLKDLGLKVEHSK